MSDFLYQNRGIPRRNSELVPILQSAYLNRMKTPQPLPFLCGLLSTAAMAQTNTFSSVEAAIHAPYTTMAVAEPVLRTAEDVADLQLRFPSDWVRTYRSVELTTQEAGGRIVTTSGTAALSPEQRAALRTHDVATPVQVAVTYIPENDLRDNPPRTYTFSSAVAPANTPVFPGGEAALQAYLQTEILEHLPAATFERYQLAAVQFTIDEEGCIQNVELVESTENPEVDQRLLATVRNMPAWKPATYTSGKATAVERVLAVGDLRSCTRNLVGLPPLE